MVPFSCYEFTNGHDRNQIMISVALSLNSSFLPTAINDNKIDPTIVTTNPYLINFVSLITKI